MFVKIVDRCGDQSLFECRAFMRREPPNTLQPGGERVYVIEFDGPNTNDPDSGLARSISYSDRNADVYVMNEAGQTVETINRYPRESGSVQGGVGRPY